MLYRCKYFTVQLGQFSTVISLCIRSGVSATGSIYFTVALMDSMHTGIVKQKDVSIIAFS